MLLTLDIQNFALIDRLTVDFEPGLNILTGETGAGKSIVIDSINAVLGSRLTKEVIRTGAASASVTAAFSVDSDRLRRLLEENGIGIEQDENLIISREISASGRSALRLNGRLTTVSLVKSAGELILDLHGQYDNHSLIKREKHSELLDNFGGKEIFPILDEYSRCYADYQQISKRISALNMDEAQRARDIDMLTFQTNEIKGAKLKPDEDERLEGRIKVLSNAERILNSLRASYLALGGGVSGEPESPGALDMLSEAKVNLSDVAAFNGQYDEILTRLTDISYMLEDAVSGIRRSIDDVEYDSGELDSLIERLEVVDRLKRKYGGSIQSANAFYTDAKRQLSEIADSDNTIDSLKKERHVLGQNLKNLAAGLTAARRNAAKTIEDQIGNELSSLEMGKAKLRVKFEQTEGYTAKGRDKIEFLFSANQDEEPKPLSKIASGGEMSRIMLAIKSALTYADNIPTMIFDEIDTGISGKAGLKVGQKMYALSRGCQIISVTHLAQIACLADNNFLVHKHFDGEKTVTEVIKLQGDARVNEISRMLGGDVAAEASRRLASEMLQKAREFKEL